MTMQGSDPEQLRALARRIRSEGAALGQVAARLQAQLAGSPWAGGDATRFRSEWSSTYHPALLRATASLHSAAERLVSNASQQDSASSAGGSHTVGNLAVAVAAATSAAEAAGTAAQDVDKEVRGKNAEAFREDYENTRQRLLGQERGDPRDYDLLDGQRQSAIDAERAAGDAEKAGRFEGLGKVAGRGLLGIGILVDHYGGHESWAQAVTSNVGGYVAGAAAGEGAGILAAMAVGAVAGSEVPIVGNIVGAVVGLGVGIIASGAIDGLWKDFSASGAVHGAEDAVKGVATAAEDGAKAVGDGAKAVGHFVGSLF